MSNKGDRIEIYIVPPKGCVTVIRMDDGDPCWIGITKGNIIIKKSKLGLLGKTIFKQEFSEEAKDGFSYTNPNVSNLFRNLKNKVPNILSEVRPELFPYIPLAIIANAALSCSTLKELETLLKENV